MAKSEAPAPVQETKTEVQAPVQEVKSEAPVQAQDAVVEEEIPVLQSGNTQASAPKSLAGKLTSFLVGKMANNTKNKGISYNA